MGGLIINALLVALQLYFLFMNFTVEMSYCERKLERGDKGFLIPTTVEFCEQHNKLFLERPDWLRNATCISAFIFPAGYMFILWVALCNHWNRFYVTVRAIVIAWVGCVVGDSYQSDKAWNAYPLHCRGVQWILFYLVPMCVLLCSHFIISTTNPCPHTLSFIVAPTCRCHYCFSLA